MPHHDPQRLHALDAVRGFALLLGVAFHAALSFMPGWPPGLWAMQDSSPSVVLGDAAFVSHAFRMTLFFLIAGYFARLLHGRLGTAGFWRNRALRIALPLAAGWVVLYPLISMVWIAGLTRVFDGNLPTPDMPDVAGAFPLAHLWFLYQLLQCYVLALLMAGLVARLDRAQALRGWVDRSVSSVLRIPVGAPFVLALPVAIALMALPQWFYWAGVPTPDQTLIPQLAPLVAFGTAFGVGWLLHRSTDALALLARHWLPNLLAGALAAAWMLASMRATPMAAGGFPTDPLLLFEGAVLTKAGFALMHGVASWGLSLGVTGAALRYLDRYSPGRRYVADASYWIYLAHLPVVVALQVLVGHWPLHWSLKYPLILAVSLGLLFASYHWLVRPTLIGQLLNGRKIMRSGQAPAPPDAPAPAPLPPAGGNREPVAILRGIRKSFGAVTALDRFDLQLQRGELLAVLGPNGAGKSTAIALWLGLLEADGGEVTLLGGAPQDPTRRQCLGMMLQDVELPKELSPRELVRLASSYYARPLPLGESLRRAGVEAFADRPYGALSGGQKRLAQFAVAICGQPRVLFLDEPSVGLDVQARQALWASVRGLLADGCSIVLTTHYLEEAEALADRVAVIARGRLVASGSVEQMRSLVALRRISCESRISVDDVGRWPGVSDARRERERLHLTASDAESVVRRLLAEDPSLARLEVREAGLVEAFEQLTREAA